MRSLLKIVSFLIPHLKHRIKKYIYEKTYVQLLEEKRK